MKTSSFPQTLAAITILAAFPAPDVAAQTPIVSNTLRYNGPANGHDRANALALDAQGNRIVTGESTNGSNNDYYTAKYSVADNSLLWERRYSATGSSGDRATAVAVDPAGHVIVTGESSISGFDYYTAKYHRDTGAILWEQRYNNGLTDSAKLVAVDSSGNVVVTGESNPVGSSFPDIFTIKYAGSDGTILWSRRHSGPVDRSDTPNAIVMDTAGNVFITGTTALTTSNSAMYTVKYDSGTGNIVWAKTYDFSATLSDSGQGIALDSQGNVIVTGASNNASSNNDIITIKYAGGDGALLWERRYNNGGTDVGRSVGVDGADNVFITGYSSNGSNEDFYTAKYAGSDGALLWEMRNHRGGNSNDRGLALVVDELGNVVVTGTANNPTLSNDNFYTIKYAGADGTFLWFVEYNNGGSSQDIPTGLALEKNGGGIVVAGRSSAAAGTAVNFDYLIVKYVDGPSSQTLAATAITSSGATLNASILPNTFATSAAIEYSLDPAFPSPAITASTMINSGQTSPVAISGTTSSLPSNTTCYFRARANGNTFTYFGEVFSFTTLNADADGDGLLDSWELAHWGTTVGHGPQDDFDGDGVEELLEQAFGLNPTVADHGAVPHPVDEGGYLTVTITRQPGVTYLVQTAGSLDAGSWNTVETTVLIDTPLTLKVRDNWPLGSAPVRFMRVRVTASP